MAYYIFKLVITTLLIVVISEISRRSTFIGALLASVPLVSVLAMVWLYYDTHDTERISSLATSVFWLVIPSLALFVSLPVLLRQGVNFPLSMAISVGITILCYGMMVAVLNHFGVRL